MTPYKSAQRIDNPAKNHYFQNEHQGARYVCDFLRTRAILLRVCPAANSEI